MSDKALQKKIDKLDDRMTFTILSHLTQELQLMIPNYQVPVHSEDESRLAIASFLETMAKDNNQWETAAKAMISDDVYFGDDNSANLADLGRKLLRLLLKDEVTRPKVNDLLTTPPEDSQMSVELAIAGAVILGTIVTWLQTKVDIKVTRRDGRTDFEFVFSKDAEDQSVVGEVVKSISHFLTSF